MQDHIGHNHRIALTAGREALQAALSTAETRLHLAKLRRARTRVELERTCWQDSAYAPTDTEYAAREALRAAHARRARLRDDIVEYDAEIIDHHDSMA